MRETFIKLIPFIGAYSPTIIEIPSEGNFNPAKHPKRTPAQQARDAKKRNNIRKFNKRK